MRYPTLIRVWQPRPHVCSAQLLSVVLFILVISCVPGREIRAQTGPQTWPQASGNGSVSIDSLSFRRDIRFSSYLSVDAEDGKVLALSGIRIPVSGSTPRLAVVNFLREFGSTLGLVPEKYQFRSSRRSVAGGWRIHLERKEQTGDSSATTGMGLVIGINQPPNLATRSHEGIFPDTFSRYRITPEQDFEKSDSNWYVYFVTRIKMDSRQTQALASADKPAPTVPTAAAYQHGSTTEADRIEPTGAAFIDYVPRISLDRGVESDILDAGMSDCPRDDYSASGTASVYKSNPNNGPPVPVELPYLCSQSTLELNGRYVSVTPESGARASSATGNFTADKSTQPFDEATAYYHADRFLALMKDVGMYSIVPDSYRMSVVVRSAENFSALAQYNINRLLFGTIQGPYLNSLHESAVIAHEASHLLMNGFYSQSYIGAGVKENWAMGEGIPDYLGIAYRARQLGHANAWLNPVLGVYFVLETQENMRRDLTNPEPNYSGWGTTNYAGHGEGISVSNVYDNSMIYSTALMDFDRFDDSEHSLSYVVESLSNLTGAPAFAAGQAALIQAVNECALIKAPDQVICCDSGSCASPVTAAFAGRGMSSELILDAKEKLESGLPASQPVSIRGNYPSPFTGTTTIEYDLNVPTRITARVTDIAGRQVTVLSDIFQSSGLHRVNWTPDGVATGMYLVEISGQGFSESHPIFYVR